MLKFHPAPWVAMARKWHRSYSQSCCPSKEILNCQKYIFLGDCTLYFNGFSSVPCGWSNISGGFFVEIDKCEMGTPVEHSAWPLFMLLGQSYNPRYVTCQMPSLFFIFPKCPKKSYDKLTLKLKASANSKVISFSFCHNSRSEHHC